MCQRAYDISIGKRCAPARRWISVKWIKKTQKLLILWTAVGDKMKGFVWCPRRVQRKFTLDSQGASKKSWEKKMPRLGLQGWLRISQTLFFFWGCPSKKGAKVAKMTWYILRTTSSSVRLENNSKHEGGGQGSNQKSWLGGPSMEHLRTSTLYLGAMIPKNVTCTKNHQRNTDLWFGSFEKESENFHF